MRTRISFAKSGADDTNAVSPEDARNGASSVHAARATILLVDGDGAVQEVFRGALERRGFIVLATTTGASAINLSRQHAIDLMIVHLSLPDMRGLEIVRSVIAEGVTRPFIVVGAFLSIEKSVEAMRLGAFDVLEKPFERVIALVQACLHKPATDGRIAGGGSEAIHLLHMNGHPGSAAHRWAMYVLKACHAESDLRTLEHWARHAGVSYSTLCESSRIIGLQPQIARDFTRALRAMVKSLAYRCDPSVLLDVSDRRTLKALLERAGPAFGSQESTVAQFIRQQRFLPISNEGIRMLLGYFDQERALQRTARDDVDRV